MRTEALPLAVNHGLKAVIRGLVGDGDEDGDGDEVADADADGGKESARLRHPISFQKVPRLPVAVSLATWDASEHCVGYPDPPSRQKVFPRLDKGPDSIKEMDAGTYSADD